MGDFTGERKSMRLHRGLLLLQDSALHGRCGFFDVNALAEHAAARRTRSQTNGCVGGALTKFASAVVDATNGGSRCASLRRSSNTRSRAQLHIVGAFYTRQG